MIRHVVLDIGPLVALLNRDELKKYQDVPMSFADACLVRMAERDAEGIVFTLDNDFSIYRKNGRQTIPTLMPQR